MDGGRYEGMGTGQEQTFVIGLLVAVSLLAAQGLCLAAGGRLEAVGPPAIVTTAAAIALAGTLAAVSCLPQGRVRTSWLIWSAGAGAWLAGSLIRDMAALGWLYDRTTLVRGVCETIFAGLGLVGLILRAPARSLSATSFVLDGLPVGFLGIGLAWTVFGDLRNEPMLTKVGSGIYIVIFVLLGLAAFQLTALYGFRRVPNNMWVLGPGFGLTAIAAVLFPAHVPPSAATAGVAVPLSTAGLLLVGAAGFRRAYSPGGYARLYEPDLESGARVAPPAVATFALIVLLYRSRMQYLHVVIPFLFAAVLCLCTRLYLGRRSVVRSRVALLQSEERYRKLFEDAGDCVFLLDSAGVITSANFATEVVLGRSREELLGRRLSDLAVPASSEVAHFLAGVEPENPQESLANELEFATKNGRGVQLELRVTRFTLDGTIVLQCVGRDVTERKRAVDALQYKALHDPLTGLANRDLFADRVERALSRRPDAPCTAAVLFLDLDGFKHINDTMGHREGDMFLATFAERLRSCTRPADTCARLGGDEFAVLIEESSAEDAATVADRILAALRFPITLGERDVVLSVSIGIALARNGASAEALLRNADIAMYKAKSGGGRRHESHNTAAA